MENKNIHSVASQLLSFQTNIQLRWFPDYQNLLSEVVKIHPEVLYYLKSYATSVRGEYVHLHVEYRNQDVPSKAVYVIRTNEVEDLLRYSVMHYHRRVVFAVDKPVNIQWIMNCFMTQSISFYPNTKSFSMSQFGFQSIPHRVYEVQFTYRIGAVKLKQMDLDVTAKIAQLRRQLFPIPMPDSAKCFIAHNYLACSIEYCNEDHGSSLERSYLQSAYGALIQKRCVCQGFAEAYKRILDAEGIPCDLISGKILDMSGEWHAWNMVHLNRNTVHCHVDVTWDAGKKASQKTYLFKGDNFFEGKRDWKRHYYTPCYEDSRLLTEAQLFCSTHKKELLRHGIQPEWIR